jgi:tricorn protease
VDRTSVISRALIACAPLLLAVVLGCPARATPPGSASADSIKCEPVMADTGIVDTDPTPSPDGKWLAYTSGKDSLRQIWVKPIAGADRGRQLTDDPPSARAMTPTWAPDSRSLLFISTRTKDYNIYSVPLEGGEARAMSDARASNRFAVYSPDGKQIVFPSNRQKPGQIWGFDLYLMDAQGERTAERPARRLTNNNGSPGHPTWSPDGRWIGYVAKPIDTTQVVQVGPGMTMQKGPMFTAYHLWRVPAAGGAEAQLTGKAATEAQPTEEIWPTWSPDGKWIAMQRRVGPTDDVWVYEVASGAFYPVTSFGDAGKPTWSPDGKSIWFHRVKGRDQDIWIAKNVTAGTLKTQAKRDARTSTAAR